MSSADSEDSEETRTSAEPWRRSTALTKRRISACCAGYRVGSPASEPTPDAAIAGSAAGEATPTGTGEDWLRSRRGDWTHRNPRSTTRLAVTARTATAPKG